MAENEDVGLDAELHEKEGSLRRGWPALILTVGMVSAAVFAFSPRHYPPFAETRIHADDMIVESVVSQDGRHVAVGELGHILTTADPEGDWQEAQVDTSRSATLTEVAFVAKDVAVAVGHSGWIVRSEDGGKSWTEIRFDEDSADPLLSIAGPFNGKLYAVGSFGQYLVSTDLGRSWQAHDPSMAESGADDKSKDSQGSDAESEDDSPFAAFASGGGVQSTAKEHYNDMAQASDGALFLVGERGLVARSGDGGNSWTQLEEIYDGSFYGLVPMPDNRMLVYGMRGHAYVTDDGGRTWQRSEIPVDHSLFGGTRTGDGRILLVGADHSVLVSEDGGATFSRVPSSSSSDIASLRHISGKAWLIAGISGVHVEKLLEQNANDGRGRS